MEKTYSCLEISLKFNYPVDDVRRWAGSNGVRFAGHGYIWSQYDYDRFAEETHYGSRNRIKFTAQSEVERLRNLHDRYSKTPPSKDPYVNKMHNAMQEARRIRADAIEKRALYDRVVLTIAGGILLSMLLGYCSLIL